MHVFSHADAKMSESTHTRLPSSGFDSSEPSSNRSGHLASEKKLQDLAGAFKTIIEAVDEDPKREGIAKTPMRAAKALCFLTKGYEQTIQDVVSDAIFDENHDDMVIVRDIEVFSLCEHHLIPFYGKATVGYLPANGKILGLSKIVRIVEMFSQRLQTQERLTKQIADAVSEVIQPSGVGVIMETTHMCMTMRGVSKPSNKTITSSMIGEFRDNPKTRDEFLKLGSSSI